MNEQRSRRWAGRTAVVTGVSIAAIALTGAVAIGASLGLLGAAGNDSVGDVTAADLIAPAAAIAPTTAPTTVPPTTVPARAGQPFQVADAGLVTLSNVDGTLRVDKVQPAAGWTWRLEQSTLDTLAVHFDNGSRSLDLNATAADDGTIGVSVDEWTTAPQVAAPPASSHGDDDGDDHGEYEGRDDDD